MNEGQDAGRLATRILAYGVLERVERDAAHADAALAAALAASGLDARDRAFATRLVYGTLAWQGRLDWHLATLAGRDPARLDAAARRVLRLGLYQILFLDRVPPHAAVATSVDLAKRVLPPVAGLVNAVLRRAVREGRALPLPDASTDPDRHLAVAFSHPEWLVARWRRSFGEELPRLLAANNDAAPTVLRARAGGRDALIAGLAAHGIAAEAGRFAPDAVHVAATDPHRLPGYAEGAFTVQSEASQLVAILVDARPGARVLDACAAPGGKATGIGERLRDGGLVVALDRRRSGATAVAATARRLGLAATVCALVADARTAAATLRGSFDRILVDAPCSGLGTLRAHPELRWRRRPEDVRRLAGLQRAILDGVAPLLAPGGALVYATCTLGEEENEGVITRWLTQHRDIQRERADEHLPAAAAPLVDARGALRTLPHRDGLDGFYAVRLRRI